MSSFTLSAASLLIVWIGLTGLSNSNQATMPPTPDRVTKPWAKPDPWWQERHKHILAEIKSRPVDLIFIGDSITNQYERDGYKTVWRRFYSDRNAVNLGFGGDTTGNVLWRLENGELQGIHPKVAVVLIGTNDTRTYRSDMIQQTVAAIEKTVSAVHAHCPSSQVLLLGILPTSVSATKTNADRSINGILAANYNNSRFVTVIDIGDVFMKNGVLDSSLFFESQMTPPGEAIHPNPRGQELMAEAIEPTLSRLLTSKSKDARITFIHDRPAR
jgi:lysophospholipase L1-like esterase